MSNLKIIDKFYELNYDKLNVDNLNNLLRNGFNIIAIRETYICIANEFIETLNRKVSNTLFTITIGIYPKDKRITSHVYIDYTKRY